MKINKIIGFVFLVLMLCFNINATITFDNISLENNKYYNSTNLDINITLNDTTNILNYTFGDYFSQWFNVSNELTNMTIRNNIFSISNIYDYGRIAQYQLFTDANEYLDSDLNGILNGSPRFKSKTYGNPFGDVHIKSEFIAFDGVGDYIEGENLFQDNVSTASVIGWFKIDDFSQTEHINIFSRLFGNSIYPRLYFVPDEDRLGLQYRVDGITQSIQIYNFSTEIVEQEWFFVSITFDGINEIVEIKVNNNTFSESKTHVGMTHFDGGLYDMKLGYDQSSGEYLNGGINHLLIYDDVLTDSEISNMYKNRITFDSNFSANAFQGIATDGTYVYTTDGSVVKKYQNNGTFIIDKTISSYSNYSHVGDLTYNNGYLYVAMSNYPTTPYGDIVKLDASTLNYVQNIQMYNNHDTSSIAFKDNTTIWVSSYESLNPIHIYKYDINWNFLERYDFPAISTSWAYDGIEWVDGKLFANPHEGSTNCIEVFSYINNTFEKIECISDVFNGINIGQGIAIDPTNESILWMAGRRDGNSAYKTILDLSFLEEPLINDLIGEYSPKYIEGTNETPTKFLNLFSKDSIYLDGIDDFVELGNVINEDIGSFSFWVKAHELYNYVSVFDNSADSNDWEMWIYATGQVAWRPGGSGDLIFSSSKINTNEWYHMVTTWDKSVGTKLYINGVLEGSAAGVGFPTSSITYIGGGHSGNSYGDISVSDFRVYNRTINQTEINYLYNELNIPYNITSKNILYDLSEFQNQKYCEILGNETLNGGETYLYVNDTRIYLNEEFYYNGGNTLNLTITLVSGQNTTPEMNITTIDCGGNPNYFEVYNICYNCSQAELNLINLFEDTYTIEFFAYNDESNATNSDYTFTIDASKPILNNNSIGTEVNTYNLTNILINYTEPNLASCYINWSDGDFTYCNDTNKNFQYNGYMSYEISILDLAGNSLTQVYNLLVNPKWFIYVNDQNGDPITDFYVDGTEYQNYSQGFVYDYGLGTHNLSLIKYGYEITSTILTLTNTSKINQTENMTIALVKLNIYNSDTSSLINDLVDIDLIGDDFAGEYTTYNGTITISNITFFDGYYHLVLDSSGYETTNYYFTYTGYASLDLMIYMQNETPTIPIKYIVKDGFGNEMGSNSEHPSCLIKITEYDITTNSYILTNMDYTNTNGEVIFNLDTSKTIKPIADCSGVITTFDGGKITSTPIYLTVNDAILNIFPDIPNINYEDITFTTLSNTTGRFTFTYSDSSGIISQACLNITQSTYLGETFIDSQCIYTSTGSINIDFNTTPGMTYYARSNVKYKGEIIPISLYIKKIPIVDFDFGMWGIIFSLILIPGLAIGGFFMGKAKGVLVGATAGLWVVWLFGTWSMGLTSSLIVWSVLLIVGLIFS